VVNAEFSDVFDSA